MTITITLEEWQACRLKALVQDGNKILSEQGRNQRGIDGYTWEDLRILKNCLNQSPHEPKFIGDIKLKP
jgi:hypothetical protein